MGSSMVGGLIKSGFLKSEENKLFSTKNRGFFQKKIYVMNFKSGKQL